MFNYGISFRTPHIAAQLLHHFRFSTLQDVPGNIARKCCLCPFPSLLYYSRVEKVSRVILFGGFQTLERG